MRASITGEETCLQHAETFQESELVSLISSEDGLKQDSPSQEKPVQVPKIIEKKEKKKKLSDAKRKNIKANRRATKIAHFDKYLKSQGVDSSAFEDLKNIHKQKSQHALLTSHQNSLAPEPLTPFSPGSSISLNPQELPRNPLWNFEKQKSLAQTSDKSDKQIFNFDNKIQKSSTFMPKKITKSQKEEQEEVKKEKEEVRKEKEEVKKEKEEVKKVKDTFSNYVEKPKKTAFFQAYKREIQKSKSTTSLQLKGISRIEGTTGNKIMKSSNSRDILPIQSPSLICYQNESQEKSAKTFSPFMSKTIQFYMAKFPAIINNSIYIYIYIYRHFNRR